MRYRSIFILIFAFLLNSNLYANRVARMLFSENPIKINQEWTEMAQTEADAVKGLIENLEKSSTGKKVLALAKGKANKQKKDLPDIIEAGNNSVCDTSLLRKFYPENPGKVMFESKSKVYINRKLKFTDATLDLAHELTHFVFRDEFNPYDEKFNPLSFIGSTIEGRGGEVDAFMMECQVYHELYPKEFEENTNCQRIKSGDGVLSRSLAIKYFYHVGHHYKDYMKDISAYQIESESLPFLSDKEAFFISSAYGAPYPIASLREYEIIMISACKNEATRVSHIKQAAARNPASTSYFLEQKKMFEKKCSPYMSVN